MTPATYLISLDKADARLADATRQLDAAGMVFERVAAFDGRDLTIEAFPDYDDQRTRQFLGRSMRGGEIGCYLSHLDCARRFLAGGAEYAVVLEDDCLVPPETGAQIEQLLAFLGRSTLPFWLINIGAVRHKIYTPLGRFDTAGMHLLTRAHYFPMTTNGLIWSRQGAEAFLSAHKQIYSPVDMYFRDWLLESDMGLAVVPPLVPPRGAESQIDTSDRRARSGRVKFYGLRRQIRLTREKALALRNRWFGPHRPRPGQR